MDEMNPEIVNPQLPQNKPKVNSLYIVFRYVAIGSGILGIGFLIALGGFLFAKNQSLNSGKVIEQSSKVPTITIIPSKNLESTITDTNIKNQKLFSNYKYKISFKYSSVSQGEPIGVKEVGSKIYIYNTKYAYTQGQYVEIFEKKPNETLDEGIKNQLLNNIPNKDCFVKDAKPDKLANFPSNYFIKTLGFPVDPNSDLPAFAQTNKCPSPYQESNGLSYFLEDINHPNIFLFFSIGQYGIMSGDNPQTTWQDTIKFLD